MITKEDDLRPNLECKAPKSEIDFKKHALVVTARSASPAQVGTDVYDDGKVVTFVNRERTPCKGDPQPILGTTTNQMSAGCDGSCTVETTCSK